MKLWYLPALKPGDRQGSRWARSPISCMDPRLRGTAAYHPRALCAYWYWRTQRFVWEPEDFIFGDSGGFSVRTLGVRIDPEAALRWQLRYCNVGVLLDAPPWKRWSQFRECLTRTVAATKAALPFYRAARKKGTPFRWWGVVHGRTTHELERWWRGVAQVYPFNDDGEGWAFKPHPLNDPAAMRQVLDFVHDKGIRRAHFFATAGYNAVDALCCYGPRAGLEWASCDSATANFFEGANRWFRVPMGGFRAKWRDPVAVSRYMMEQCRCVSCHLLRQDVQEDPSLMPDDPKQITNSIYVKHRLILHNTLTMLDEFETLRRRYAELPTSGG